MLKRTVGSRLGALWVACLLSSSIAARAEPPLTRSLLPEPLHAADERALPPATVRTYQRIMAAGVSEFERGHWAEARSFFRHGHELLPNARSFRVLGMTAFNLTLYPVALRELSEALNDPRRPLQGTLRAQTERLRERAEAFVGRYHVWLEPPRASLRVDGLATKLEPDGTLLLAVGEHVLEVEAPEHVRSSRSLRVNGHDDQHLFLRTSPRMQPTAAQNGQLLANAPAPAPSLVAALLGPKSRGAPPSTGARVFADYRWTWVLGVGSSAFGGAAGFVHLRAVDEARRVEARCPGICKTWTGETDRRDQLNRLSDGLLIGSLVFAVATVAIALVEHDHVDERERARQKLLALPVREPGLEGR